MAEKVTVSAHCPKCGATVDISDTVPDDTIIKCKSCGETFGTLADVKAKAVQAVSDTLVKPVFDKIKRIFDRS